jgi:phage shock protein E
VRRVFALVMTMGVLAVGCSADESSTVLSPEQTVSFLTDNPDAILIDVRTPAEVADGYLAGAVLLDALDPSFTERAATLDPNATYVVYCRSGNRSAAAINVLTELGFTSLYDAGAFTALANAGVPTA